MGGKSLGACAGIYGGGGMSETCSVIFSRFDARFNDENGCVLDSGHIGPHKFIDDKKVVTWETDYECDCDDCKSDDCNDWCILYSITNQTGGADCEM